MSSYRVVGKPMRRIEGDEKVTGRKAYTADVLVPGTLCLLIGLTALTFTGMSMGREREMGTLETLLSAPVAPVEIMLGKTVPFAILGMVQLPIATSSRALRPKMAMAGG